MAHPERSATEMDKYKYNIIQCEDKCECDRECDDDYDSKSGDLCDNEQFMR